MIAELVKAGLGGFEEVELPDWLGEALYSDENGVLIKGAGHKYIRRVPKAGGGWRYFYTVTGGHGLGHHAEMVRGSAFKVKDAGREGHFHVEEDHGEEVTLRHDETGKTSKVSKKALAAMLHAEHAEAVGKVRARVTANLEQAKKTGSAKQQERAAALVSKYGGPKEQPQGLEVGGSGPRAVISARPEDPVPSERTYEERQEVEARAIRLDLPEQHMAHLIKPGARGLQDDSMARGPVSQAVLEAVRTFLRAGGVPNPEDFKLTVNRVLQGRSGSDTLYRVHVNSAHVSDKQLQRGTSPLFRVLVRVGADGRTADKVGEVSGSPAYEGHSFDLQGNRREAAIAGSPRVTIKAPAGLTGAEFNKHGGASAGKAHWWLQHDDSREFIDLGGKFTHPGHQEFNHTVALDPGWYTLGVGDAPRRGAGRRHAVDVDESGSVYVDGELVKSLARLARVF